jgi:hypothetical protein
MISVRTLALVGCFASHIQVWAQIGPDYMDSVEIMLREDPSNEAYQKLHRTMEAQIKALFRDLPPVQLITLDGHPAKQLAQKDNFELELRQSGIKVKEDNDTKYATLIAQVNQGRDGKWSVRFELQEWVTLDRPGFPQIQLSTYFDEGTVAPTHEKAVEVVGKCFKDFCLMYMKYSR